MGTGREMNVLSLFDGMSCGKIALDNLGIKYDNYFASEIDKHAIQVSKNNHNNVIHIGDVTKLVTRNGKLVVNDVEYTINVILAGSPCTGFSVAGKQLNFNDPQSKLFFEFVKLKNELNPKYWLLENVRMKKQYSTAISELLEVPYVSINSALVSAQNRIRLYWANFEITQPEDKGIMLKDILESPLGVPLNYSSSGRGNKKVEARVTDAVKAACLTATGYSNRSSTNVVQINPDKSAGGKQPHMQDRVDSVLGKSCCLTAAFANRCKVGVDMVSYRDLTILEQERLQTLPERYTQGVSERQRSKMIGNGWTIKVIEHILRPLKE